MPMHLERTYIQGEIELECIPISGFRSCCGPTRQLYRSKHFWFRTGKSSMFTDSQFEIFSTVDESRHSAGIRFHANNGAVLRLQTAL
jgi:hypothetical protein